MDPLLFFLCSSKGYPILEYNSIGYADDSTLLPVVLSPGVRVTVAESLYRDFSKVDVWCDLWRMKLNASKTTTMIVSGSCRMHPHAVTPINLTIDGIVLKESDDLDIFEVIFDSKMTFEKHLLKDWFLMEILEVIQC